MSVCVYVCVCMCLCGMEKGWEVRGVNGWERYIYSATSIDYCFAASAVAVVVVEAEVDDAEGVVVVG